MRSGSRWLPDYFPPSQRLGVIEICNPTHSGDQLVMFATKLAEQGEIKITAHKILDEFGHPQLQVCVIDSGIGIEADWQQKVFQPFCQVDGSTTRQYSGLGLGLALSVQLVNVLDGFLRLESQPQQKLLTEPVTNPAKNSCYCSKPFC